MGTILILIVLKLGAIQGVYLGEYDSPKLCERASAEAAQVIGNSNALEGVDAAALICVPKQEA